MPPLGPAYLAMLVFAALDIQEVVHQSDEDRTGLAILAGFVAAVHILSRRHPRCCYASRSAAYRPWPSSHSSTIAGVTAQGWIALFVAAALAEIGGAYLVWIGLREHRGLGLRSALGVLALGLYGIVATFQPSHEFGRVLAAYGGVFIVGSLSLGAFAFDGFHPEGRRSRGGSGAASPGLGDHHVRALQLAAMTLGLRRSGQKREVLTTKLRQQKKNGTNSKHPAARSRHVSPNKGAYSSCLSAHFTPIGWQPQKWSSGLGTSSVQGRRQNRPIRSRTWNLIENAPWPAQEPTHQSEL